MRRQLTLWHNDKALTAEYCDVRISINRTAMFSVPLLTQFCNLSLVFPGYSGGRGDDKLPESEEINI